jgi:hypothetical protein
LEPLNHSVVQRFEDPVVLNAAAEGAPRLAQAGEQAEKASDEASWPRDAIREPADSLIARSFELERERERDTRQRASRVERPIASPFSFLGKGNATLLAAFEDK